jgi:hypothetical protein
MRAATAEALRFASRFCYFDERPSDHTAHHGAASLEPFTMPVAGVTDTSGQGCWHETNAGIRLYRGSASNPSSSMRISPDSTRFSAVCARLTVSVGRCLLGISNIHSKIE